MTTDILMIADENGVYDFTLDEDGDITNGGLTRGVFCGV